MREFQAALEKLSDKQKLVIVVDELDRCRPDYALSLPEVIKHFFAVPNVHFVLGVNLKELGNSVRARYGQRVNAEKYLQKFVSLVMPLTPPATRHTYQKIPLQHFSHVVTELGFRQHWKYSWLEKYLSDVDHHAGLSLRDVEKIATLALVAPSPPNKPDANTHLYTELLILNVVEPLFVEKARRKELSKSGFFLFSNYNKGIGL